MGQEPEPRLLGHLCPSPPSSRPTTDWPPGGRAPSVKTSLSGLAEMSSVKPQSSLQMSTREVARYAWCLWRGSLRADPQVRALGPAALGAWEDPSCHVSLPAALGQTWGWPCGSPGDVALSRQRCALSIQPTANAETWREKQGRRIPLPLSYCVCALGRTSVSPWRWAPAGLSSLFLPWMAPAQARDASPRGPSPLPGGAVG